MTFPPVMLLCKCQLLHWFSKNHTNDFSTSNVVLEVPVFSDFLRIIPLTFSTSIVAAVMPVITLVFLE